MPRGLRTKPKLPKFGMGKGIIPEIGKMPRSRMIGPKPPVGPKAPKMGGMVGGMLGGKPKKTLRPKY